MSGNDRPELRAFRELETLVHHLGEELAAFRRRALSAEAQLKGGDGAGGGHSAKTASRAGAGHDRDGLEEENAALRQRLDRAEDRVRQMMDRVRFLRQQLQAQAPAPDARVGAGRS
jgi:hypothetical protein